MGFQIDLEDITRDEYPRCDTCSKRDLTVSMCEVCIQEQMCINCGIQGELSGDVFRPITMCSKCATCVISRCTDREYLLWMGGWNLVVEDEEYMDVMVHENDVWNFHILPEQCRTWFAKLICSARKCRENVGKDPYSEEVVSSLNKFYMFLIHKNGFGSPIIDDPWFVSWDHDDEYRSNWGKPL